MMLDEAPQEATTFDRAGSSGCKGESPPCETNDVEQGGQDVKDAQEAEMIDVKVYKNHMYLLILVFIWFGLFAIAEIVASSIANSLSLMGDAACMIVDSATYGMNMGAETCKRKGVSEKRRLKLELFIPLVSMLALMGTSCYVLDDATQTIRAGGTFGTSSTNANIMLIFSCVGLAMDFISVFSFTFIQGFMGFELKDKHGDNQGIEVASNTNMCSAYSHVLADTGRSIAAIVAAVVAMTCPNVNAGLSDAWGSVVITIIIFLSLIPLAVGLVQKVQQLYALNQRADNR